VLALVSLAPRVERDLHLAGLVKLMPAQKRSAVPMPKTRSYATWLAILMPSTSPRPLPLSGSTRNQKIRSEARPEREAAAEAPDARREPRLDHRVENAPKAIPEHIVDRGRYPEGRHRLQAPDERGLQIGRVKDGAQRALKTRWERAPAPNPVRSRFERVCMARYSRSISTAGDIAELSLMAFGK
jgi:hypothetical protein